ncbi:MAG TPA: A/G-specific adenine glycosylase [Burkholderiales bacterium]|nr:A/G-specific adenine glycosylase [Burkholderiales bacterium]
MPSFAAKVVAWQKRHGRHNLPWQNTRDPYRIWVSEIMLQQTQVVTVIPYYLRFVERFPDMKSLACASLDEVLTLWSGLGYYSRAANLHRAAQVIMNEHRGLFPRKFDSILELPGIGRSTAAAICVFAFGQKRAILDGNVKRVLARCFGVAGYPGEKNVQEQLWRKSEALLPKRGSEAYTQGLMDLGAEVCLRRNPDCPACPLHRSCVAFKTGRVNQLPALKPRKALPHRQTVMLILLHKGEVLLEKRPPAGVWAGMWSFPELGPEEDVRKICTQRFGARAKNPQYLPRVEHGFSHFELSIQPILLQVEALRFQAMEPGKLWLNVSDAQHAALPAPVRKLLQQAAALNGKVTLGQ